MPIPTAHAGPPLLVAPADPRGAALSAFAIQVRRAVQQHEHVLVVDESACSRWTPGQRLVLERLRLLVERCGCRWSTAPATTPAPSAGR